MEKSAKLGDVAEYIERSSPKPLLEIYAALADFDYPIDDAAAFHGAIDERVGANGLANEVGQLFRQAFEPPDFPIASAQNALEKLNFRLPAAARIVPLEAPPPPPERSADSPTSSPTCGGGPDLGGDGMLLRAVTVRRRS